MQSSDPAGARKDPVSFPPTNPPYGRFLPGLSSSDSIEMDRIRTVGPSVGTHDDPFAPSSVRTLRPAAGEHGRLYAPYFGSGTCTDSTLADAR